jgi:hypothetical protein
MYRNFPDCTHNFLLKSCDGCVRIGCSSVDGILLRFSIQSQLGLLLSKDIFVLKKVSLYGIYEKQCARNDEHLMGKQLGSSP